MQKHDTAIAALCSVLSTTTVIALRTDAMTQLDLRGHRISSMQALYVADLLAASTVLTKLNLDGFELNLPQLRGTEPVQVLDLKSKRLGVASGIVIASLITDNTVLSDCSLLKNNLDVESAKMLAKIGTEKQIMLSGMKRDQTEANFRNQSLTPADAILISSDLPFMAVLTSLNLAYNNIGPKGAKAIAEALGSGKAVLTDLNLADNRLGAEGAKAIADALASGKAVLTSLNLAGSPLSAGIGPEGSKAIAEALKVNAVLTDLNLAYSSFGAEGAKAIADALASGKAVLTTLDLHNNNLDAEAGKALAAALKENAVLTSLNLSGNNLGKDGAIAIAEALKSGKAVLKKCDLTYNSSMGGNARAALQEAVKAKEGFELLLN